MTPMHPFRNGPLTLNPDPIVSIQDWLKEAKDAGLPEPTSMSLATVNNQGVPSLRIVLIKGFSQSSSAGRQGVEFFTNYESRKGKELLSTRVCALCFHWVTMRRQIRVEGTVEKLSSEESDAYFQSRPRESRLGAWSSPQSKAISSRAELEAEIAKVKARFGDEGPVPCPPHWGGFRVVPSAVEFWEERPFRLHERRRYEWDQTSRVWAVTTLAP